MKVLYRYQFCLLLWLLPFALAGQTITWKFPINRTHAGILLGNGVQGLMVWGDTTLNITVGRAGFWDHRGGNDFASRADFSLVKELVAQQAEDSLRKLFTYVPPAGQPGRPQQLGGGVWKLHLPKGYQLRKGVLHTTDARIVITLQDAKGKSSILAIKQSVYKEIAWVELPSQLIGKVKSELIPMWEWNYEKLQSVGVEPPQSWQEKNITGFTQTLPRDAPLSIGVLTSGNEILLSSNVGTNAKSIVLRTLQNADTGAEERTSRSWWKSYWSEVAHIRIPDEELQEAVDYGLYKQACATPPHGIASTLQGAFMEEYQLPPWSNDYHFNINQQMIYTPALATNRVSHFKPLLELMDSLMPVLRRNGQLFFGNPAAVMFPHAVDDRGQAIGNYWGGTIDHATTAWAAFLTWQYYEYSGDTTYLRKLTYPLLTGALEGFWSMMEKTTNREGNVQYSLPVSVSPEYGSGLAGVGRNASFQLAAIHRIIRILPIAAARLRLPLNTRWKDIETHLPLYTLVDNPYGESTKKTPLRIGLWEGKDLDISHRHHSHLGGIYPFQTINLSDSVNYKIAEKSYWRWVNAGAGNWTGWCLPWASIIHNRMGNTEAAISWLHYWKRNFVNEGRGTLHNTTNLGMAMMNEPLWAKEIAVGRKNHEIMQLDAGFGVLSAVLDLLVQETPQGVYILRNRSWRWENVQFDRVRIAGGFLVSAVVKDNKVQWIKIKSVLGGTTSIMHGLGERVLVNGEQVEGVKVTLTLAKGQEATLRPI